MSSVKVAATQLAIDLDSEKNVVKAIAVIREAAGKGANIILLQELFATHYFCKQQLARYYDWAFEVKDHPFLNRFSALAAELNVVLPISFFERSGNCFFNSLVMIDADGSLGEVYRKSHIPDGPGYCEKFYFSPGDSGFKVWKTRFGNVGVGICWDQWFPEVARCLALNGAEIIFYPTAIGSEPKEPELDSSGHWQRVMQGHAASNMVPIVAANRVGREVDDGVATVFYGSSFITNETGEKIAEADRETETIIYADLDLVEIRKARVEWGIFRDRRPDLYKDILQLSPASTK